MPKFDMKLTSEETSSLKEYRNTARITMAEVMDTRDPLHNGRLMVWPLNSGNRREDPRNWVIAKCADSRYGLNTRDSQSDKSTVKDIMSFGSWNPLPYIGNYVFIFYPQGPGEAGNPFWFGSILTNMHTMIPGISYDMSQNVQEPDYSTVTEKDYFKPQNNPQEKEKRSEYSPIQNSLERQGLDKDRLRGISTSTSVRESPSRCYGYSSPLGNQFIIDDGWSNAESTENWDTNPRKDANDNREKEDNGIYHSNRGWMSGLSKDNKEEELSRFESGFRLRTRNGTQLLILDTGNIYMITKTGDAWVELSDDGYIDCYSKRGINCASDGDINLHSKSNVNIEADGAVNIKGQSGVKIESGTTTDIECSNTRVSTLIQVPNIEANVGNLNTFTSKNAQINGVFQGTLQGTAFYATHAGKTPTPQTIPVVKDITLQAPEEIKKQEIVQGVDEDKVESITTRMPTHEPYAGHDKNNFIPLMSSRKLIRRKAKKLPEVTPVKKNIINQGGAR